MIFLGSTFSLPPGERASFHWPPQRLGAAQLHCHPGQITMTQKAKGLSHLPPPVDPLCLGHLLPSAPASLYWLSSQETMASILLIDPLLLPLLVEDRRPLGLAKIAPSKQAPGQLFISWESGPSSLSPPTIPLPSWPHSHGVQGQHQWKGAGRGNWIAHSPPPPDSGSHTVAACVVN